MSASDHNQLVKAVERMHGGSAQLTQSMPVRETFKGKPVWEGVVHVFDLAGHPTATRAYAWSSPIEGKHEAAFLCRAAYRADQLAARGGAGGDRSRKKSQRWRLSYRRTAQEKRGRI